MSKKIKEDNRRVWHIRVGNADFKPSQTQLEKIRAATVKALGDGNVVLVSDSMFEIQRLA